MIVAKLVGNIWATRKSDALTGIKMMLAEPIDSPQSEEIMVVADFIGAGIGDRVIIARGAAARKMCPNENVPIDAAVIGIVDDDCKF